jgi:hypothetical protein
MLREIAEDSFDDLPFGDTQDRSKSAPCVLCASAIRRIA